MSQITIIFRLPQVTMTFQISQATITFWISQVTIIFRMSQLQLYFWMPQLTIVFRMSQIKVYFGFYRLQVHSECLGLQLYTYSGLPNYNYIPDVTGSNYIPGVPSYNYIPAVSVIITFQIPKCRGVGGRREGGDQLARLPGRHSPTGNKLGSKMNTRIKKNWFSALSNYR